MAYSIGPLRYNPSGTQLAHLLESHALTAPRFGRRLVYDPGILGPLYDPYSHAGRAYSRASKLPTFGRETNAAGIGEEFRGLWKRLQSGARKIQEGWSKLFQGPRLSPQGVPVRVNEP